MTRFCCDERQTESRRQTARLPAAAPREPRPPRLAVALSPLSSASAVGARARAAAEKAEPDDTNKTITRYVCRAYVLLALYARTSRGPGYRPRHSPRYTRGRKTGYATRHAHDR